MNGIPVDVEQFALDDLLTNRDPGAQFGRDDQITGLVHAQPDTVRSILRRVMQGDAEMLAGDTEARISRLTMDAFEDCVLREGGESFMHRRDPEDADQSTVFVRLGKVIISHGRREPIADSAEAQRHKTEEDARRYFRTIKGVLATATPKSAIYDGQIEVEWDELAHVRVRES